jgi:uncharacterized lipoprotein YddW (UPF0748 family)
MCARLLVIAFISGLLQARSSAQQQFRAAWADVFHNGMQSQSQVDTMVSTLVSGHYNAVIVQVLAYMDNAAASHGAYWKSSILPWSGYTTASFDPLAYLCTKAHANGIEVHAWLGGSGAGMYRIATAWPPSGNATLTAHPEWTMVPRANSEGNAVALLDGNYALDMGSPDAQDYIVSIVRELATNYPIDGINWDDEINSAGQTAGMGFPAYSQANYGHSGLARYRINTGYVGTPTATDATYGNYRRRFKNELIARCQAEIQSIKTNPRQPLRHTLSGMAYGDAPTSCGTFTTSSAYMYYSDWAGMLQNGWVDAVIPMAYKTFTNSSVEPQLTNWCNRCYSCWRYSRQIFMGLGAYLNTRSNTLSQLQYNFNGQSGGNGLNGAVTYSYGVPFATSYDSGNWWTYVEANLYTSVVATPTMPWRIPGTATEGIMWGRVRDAKTGASLDNATVRVSGGSTVNTDGNGYYVATLVSANAAGTVHSLSVSNVGYVNLTNSAAKAYAGDVARYDFYFTMPSLKVKMTATNTVVVSWPSPTPGWTLQQTASLSGGTWASSPETVNDSGTEKYVVVSGSPARFYRLLSP